MKKFDCGIIGEELCIAIEPKHHYLIKFTLKEGKWRMNKRCAVRVKGHPFPKITMTTGYYEKPMSLNAKIKESDLTLLMEMAANG